MNELMLLVESVKRGDGYSCLGVDEIGEGAVD